MKTMSELYNSFDAKRKSNIKSHYKKYENQCRYNGYSFITLNEWIDSYNDLRNIFNLMSESEVK